MRISQAVAIATVCFAGGGLAAPALAASPLASGVVLAKDVAGLQRARVPAGLERHDLSVPLSLGLRRRVSRAPIATSGFSGGGLDVRSASFRLGRWAAAVLSAWRHKSRAVTVGDGGFIQVGRHAGRLVFRVGPVVVLLEADGAGKGASQLLSTLAQNVASRLQAPPLSGLEAALGGHATDMSLPRSVALRAFAAVYGLPGVSAPAGPPTEDGTEAIGFLLRYQSTLTPAQRGAAEQELGVGLPGPAAVSRRAVARSAALTYSAEWSQAAEKYEAQYGVLIGRTFTLPIKAFFGPTADDAKADALPISARRFISPTPAYCRVRLSQSGFNAASQAENQETIAHEAFYCVTFQLNPDSWDDLSHFVLEGLAEWAAETLVPQGKRLDFAQQYFGAPGQDPWTRSYDAAFIFGRAAEVRQQPLWGSVNQLVNEYSQADVFNTLGIFDDAFLDTWASSMFLAEGAGPDWTTSNPVQWSTSSVSIPKQMMTTDHLAIGAPPLGNALYFKLIYPDPVLLVRITTGFARLGDGTGTENWPLDGAGSAWVCGAGESACESCPHGGHPQFPPGTVNVDAGILRVGLNGGVTGGSGVIDAFSVNDFCDDATVTPDPDQHGYYDFTRPPADNPDPEIALPELTRYERIEIAPNWLTEVDYLHEAYDTLQVLIEQYRAAYEFEQSDYSPEADAATRQRENNAGAVVEDISNHMSKVLSAAFVKHLDGYRAVTYAQVEAGAKIEHDAINDLRIALTTP